MEPREYQRLAAVEERMWWFRGLHANLFAAWSAAAQATDAPLLLDAGCGTGGLLARLAAWWPRARLVGLDKDRDACAVAKAKSGRPVIAGSVDALPLAEGALDGVFSADVLCHVGVDEVAAVKDFARCLKPGGVLVLNLPAYRWLFSAHDRAVDNARRYSRREVERLLSRVGFTRVRARYWNSFLFPLMVVRRLIRRGSAGASEVSLAPPPVEALFAAVLGCETRLARAGLRLPFGGSILATAVKP